MAMRPFNSKLKQDSSALTLGEMGEKAFVGRLLTQLNNDPRLFTGQGNDAAAVQLPFPTNQLAFKIDRAAKPIAFQAGWADARVWGRLAVTATCSDILASGAVPYAFMVSISMPAATPAAEAEAVVLGSVEECERRDVLFAGGDTKESSDAQVVGSAIGIYPQGRKALARSGARGGDLLVLAGPAGGFVGAELLLRSNAGAPSERDEWIHYLAMPAARWAEAEYVNTSASPVAAVDASDGTFDAIVELTRGKLGVRIDLAKIPFHPFAVRCSREFGYPLRNFLFGPGDWNIVYAVHAGDRLDCHAAGCSVTTIGEFTSGSRFTASDEFEMYEFSGPRNEQFRQHLGAGETFSQMVAMTPWFVPYKGHARGFGE